MITRRRLIYLYLALTCFVGFIIVFFVDGYMGVYDTLYMTAGEREQKVELHQWLRTGGVWGGGARWGEKAFFCYEISNQKFSTYSADIEVSLWHDEELVRPLVSQHLQIGGFGKGTLEWMLDTVELLPDDAPPPRHSYNKYYILIKSGEMERKLKFYIFSPSPLRT